MRHGIDRIPDQVREYLAYLACQAGHQRRFRIPALVHSDSIVVEAVCKEDKRRFKEPGKRGACRALCCL